MTKRSIGVVSMGALRDQANAAIVRHGSAEPSPEYDEWLIDQLARLLFGANYEALTTGFEKHFGRPWETGKEPPELPAE